VKRIAWTDLTAVELARFRSLIRQGPGCHEWSGETNSRGYGRFTVYRGGRRVRFLAHRLALTLALGREPNSDTRHTCDNPPCCRGGHLLEGDRSANMLDAKRRGRADLSGLDALRELRRQRATTRLATGRKTCSGCGQAKPLEAFSRNRSYVDGRQ